jgi:hypothetical protein
MMRFVPGMNVVRTISSILQLHSARHSESNTAAESHVPNPELLERGQQQQAGRELRQLVPVYCLQHTTRHGAHHMSISG